MKYADGPRGMPRQPNVFWNLPNTCETCGGDGSDSAMFDENCPAAWAHRFVRAEVNQSGPRPPRVVHDL